MDFKLAIMFVLILIFGALLIVAAEKKTDYPNEINYTIWTWDKGVRADAKVVKYAIDPKTFNARAVATERADNPPGTAIHKVKKGEAVAFLSFHPSLDPPKNIEDIRVYKPEVTYIDIWRYNGHWSDFKKSYGLCSYSKGCDVASFGQGMQMILSLPD